MKYYNCHSTGSDMTVMAKNPKEAAYTFMEQLTQGLYQVKMHKVLYGAVKKDPDTSITVTEVGTEKVTYFQFTTFMNNY